MARQKKDKKVSRGIFQFRRKVLPALVVSVIVLVSGGLWYAFQPHASRLEINRVFLAWLEHRGEISCIELISDILSVRDANAPLVSFSGNTDAPPGGLPLANRRLLLLKNGSFAVGYDEDLRLPAWVAYRLFDGDWFDAGDRPSAFLPDRRLAKPVTSDEYTGSGYDRGHLAPNHAIAKCYGPDAQNETFVLSNIVPQKHGFNAGVWKNLEQREIRNYALRYGEIWVIAGPVFGNVLRRTESGLPIPEKLFKIIVCVRGGKLYALAFMMDQNAAGRYGKYLCSIDDIEKLAGLDFLAGLTDEQQKIVESRPAMRAW